MNPGCDIVKGVTANHLTPTLPRVSRILLYLGYSLLTVTVVS